MIFVGAGHGTGTTNGIKTAQEGVKEKGFKPTGGGPGAFC